MQLTKMMFTSSIKFTECTPANVGSLLNTCAKNKFLKVGCSIHANILRFDWWWSGDIFVQNNLLNLYAKCEKLKCAHQLFDKMRLRNTITWTMLISGYDQCGKSDEALEIFSRMVAEDFAAPPNEFTYACAISSCAKQEHLRHGMQIHSHALQRGFVSHVLVSNVLISHYMACGLILEAKLIFQEIHKPDQVSWNSLLAGLLQNNLLEDALEGFQRMRKFEETVTSFALSTAVSACSDNTALGKGLHALSAKKGLDMECYTGCALIRMYSKVKNMEGAVRVFDRLHFKDVASWNSLVEGYAEIGQGENGLLVFNVLMGSGMRPDEITVCVILGICRNLAILKYGKQVHSLCLRAGLDRRVRVQNSMIDMYSKCGSLDDGLNVFSFMDDRTVISWTSIMAGLAHHGRALDVINFFEEMRREGFKPNKITYTCVLSACNHGGLIDIGWSVFDSMEMEPEVDHLVCMVHMLIGGGRFEEAREFICRYSEQKELLQQAFLVACKNMGEWERGYEVAEEVMKDGVPTDSLSLVLLSTLFAATGRWEEAGILRKEMKERKIKKEPACSWIEVDNAVQVYGMNI